MPKQNRSAPARATAAHLRRIALALPDAVETLTWGEPHFRVQNKIFTGLGVRDGRTVSSVKLEKAQAEVRSFDPRFRPAPYVGRYGWVEFALEDVTVGELEELIAESYRLVAKTKKKPGPTQPAGGDRPPGRAGRSVSAATHRSAAGTESSDHARRSRESSGGSGSRRTG